MENILIQVDNIDARIESALVPSVTTLIYEELKYHPDGYEHVYSYKSKRWDGYNRLFKPTTLSFRRGLLPRVQSILEDAGYKVLVNNKMRETGSVEHKFNSELIRPFAFQQGVIPAMDHNDVGIIVSPTGSGKTVMIGMMINAARKYTMVMVTDVVLLDQMQQALQRLFDQPIGMIGDGEFDLQPITVTTLQSFVSITSAKTIGAADKRKILLQYLNMVGMVISDEAHLYDSESVDEVMKYFTHTTKFYGMSATPYGWAEKAEKRSNLELEQHFGNVIYDCRKNNFVELGLKATLLVNIINRTPLKKDWNIHWKADRHGKKSLDHTKNYKECLNGELLDNFDYHDEVAEFANDLVDGGRSVFVHAPHRLSFSQSIQERIPDSVLINGSTPRLKRRAIYDAMRKKELLALVSDVGGTGLDIPSLDALILAGDMKDIRQLKGRVERASPGKSSGLLIDLNTDTQFLGKHHAIRRSQYKSDSNIILG